VWSPSKRSRAHCSSIAAMTPVADFCNHSYTRSLSHFEFCRRGTGEVECVSLVCDNDVKAGEEIFICYGAKTTAQLLCFYGFHMGCPLPCDVLHVVLVIPAVSSISHASVAAVAACDPDVSDANACLEFLLQCQLRIGTDCSITCALISSLQSPVHHPSTSSSAATSPTASPSHAPHSAPPTASISLHSIVYSQPCIELLTAVASNIRAACGQPCHSNCRTQSQSPDHLNPTSSQTEGDRDGWLQVLCST
jgi:hypothetical protein